VRLRVQAEADLVEVAFYGLLCAKVLAAQVAVELPTGWVVRARHGVCCWGGRGLGVCGVRRRQLIVECLL
jgi:hypothetical protein